MKELKTYRESCHIEDCETRFIGITVEEYVEHLKNKHGRTKAKIIDRLVVGFCKEHGEYELTDYGRCPECE